MVERFTIEACLKNHFFLKRLFKHILSPLYAALTLHQQDLPTSDPQSELQYITPFGKKHIYICTVIVDACVIFNQGEPAGKWQLLLIRLPQFGLFCYAVSIYFDRNQ